MKRMFAVVLGLWAACASGAGVYKAEYNTLNLDDRPMVVTNVTFDGLATTGEVHQAIVDATNNIPAPDMDKVISTNNPAFVAAVTNCPAAIDPEDASDLGDYGTYGTIGAVLAALAAGLAAMKKGKQNKITASGILKGDGSGGVTAAVGGTDYATAAQGAKADAALSRKEAEDGITEWVCEPSTYDGGTLFIRYNGSGGYLLYTTSNPDPASNIGYVNGAADAMSLTYQGEVDWAGSEDLTATRTRIPTWADVNAKAPLASPALTGTPTAPTAATGTNTTQVATTAFVKTAVDAVDVSSQIEGKLDSVSAAPAFSTTATYLVGDYVTYQGQLYRFKAVHTGAWAAADVDVVSMTSPDVTLDIMNDGTLRVAATDGTTLWRQGYNLQSTASLTLVNESVNKYSFSANDTGTVTLVLPTAPTGKVADYMLDVTNPALDTTFSGLSAYSSSTAYAVGDIVTNNSKIWRCTTTISSGEAWTASHWEEAWPSLSLGAALDNTISVVVPRGKSLSDMFAVEPGTMVRFYFTLTGFAVNGLPTYQIGKQVVENGGAS